jgi:uncharacterized protein
VVRQPDGAVVLDATGRAAGRGAYLCADGACWNTALTRGTLQRALETPLPADLRERLEQGAQTMMPNMTSAMIDGHEGDTIGQE